MRGDPAATGPVHRAHTVFMPFIVLAEIRAGIRGGTRQEQNESNLTEFLSANRVDVLFPDEATTHFYAEILVQLRRAGTPIPTNDMWIAALAIQHDLVLLTRDRHFDVVPRLARM